MLQIAAEELEVPIDMVHTNETTTDAIANAQATSASFSADLNGPAVMEACQKLRKRLDLIKGKCLSISSLIYISYTRWNSNLHLVYLGGIPGF